MTLQSQTRALLVLAKLAKRVSFFAAPFALVQWVRRACKVPPMHHASHNSVPARSAPAVWVSGSSAGQGLTNRSLPRDRKVSLLQPVLGTLVVIETVTHASSLLLEKEIYGRISESTNLQNESITQAPLWS